jgi:hypothetical protein
MIEDLTLDQYEAALREDFASFVARCFYDLNPQADLAARRVARKRWPRREKFITNGKPNT